MAPGKQATASTPIVNKPSNITEALCGTIFSKILVSQLVGKLDAELTAWRTRRLDGMAHRSLTVDARYEDVRCEPPGP